MKFDQAVEIILKHEGGYINHLKDPGGETNFGISKRTYPNEDIKNLTVERAREIYRRDFWDALSLDLLPPILRLIVFDSAVNQGPGAAVGMLQACVGAKVDGAIGPQTIGLVSKFNAKTILERYAARRLERYLTTRGFASFGAGWLKRLLNVSILSATLEGGEDLGRFT